MEVWSMVPTLLAVAAVGLFIYFKRIFSYFNGRDIPQASAIAGLKNLYQVFTNSITVAEMINKLYNLEPRNTKYVAFFDILTPSIMVRDLDLIRSIMVKNFEHFQDHRLAGLETEWIFGKNLFSLCGERWKEVRTLLSPAFTSSKMKGMYKLMRECGVKYGNFFASLPENERSIELKEAFTRYTNDVIATCAFGLEVDSMRDRENTFYMYGRRSTNFDKFATIRFFIVRGFPTLSKLLGIKIIEQKVVDFFLNLVSNTIKTRDEKGIVRPDMIQLMMETRGKMPDPSKELTIKDMTANAFIFFFGGFDSTATTMCFAAHEVGANPEIQKRLQDEIDEVLENGNGEVSYEAINEMKFLDAVVNETLRMYPVNGLTDRTCTKDFELPPAYPGGKPVAVRKGEFLAIPIYGIQHDPQYYEDPEEFKPDRFMADPKKVLNSGAFLSFGQGPRMCIANRFAILETKVLLFSLFARCTLKPNEKTCIPMELSKDGFQMKAKSGFWFDIVPREAPNTVLVNSVCDSSAVY